MDLDKGAYEGLKYYFRHFDSAHERDEIFKKLGYIDIQFLAPRIRAKVMLTTCLMDTICPPSTQFAAYNKMTCEKSVIFYPDYGHEIPGHMVTACSPSLFACHKHSTKSAPQA